MMKTISAYLKVANATVLKMWINHEFCRNQSILVNPSSQLLSISVLTLKYVICFINKDNDTVSTWYFLYTKLLMFCLLLIFRCKMPHSGAGSLTGFLSPEKIDGVLSLVGGFCLHLTLGTLYCFGNLNTYMTSYLRKHVHPGIEYSDMIWIPCLATISQVIYNCFFSVRKCL